MNHPLLADSRPIVVDCHLDDGGERRLPEDVLDGLTRPFKEIPPKHFYDSRGSELFERICELPEYYPTRTELRILRERAEEIVEVTAAAELVELGCGAPVKARLLLEAIRAGSGGGRYVPVDVSERVVREAAATLAADYPDLRVHGVVGDFDRHLDRVPPPERGRPRLVAFLGGTIGNFPPGSRRRFLRALAGLLRPEDRLLLGADLVKDPQVIEAAYDDSAGVTAEFNRNILHVVNRELGADFDPESFEHVAFYDRRHEWVEMRLRARQGCEVRIAALGLDVRFAPGEEIRTEISAKFTPERLEADFAAAGLDLAGWFTDPDRLFSLTLAQPSA